MLKGQPCVGLPNVFAVAGGLAKKILHSTKSSTKLAMVLLLTIFLANYQPSSGNTPFSSRIVYAENQQVASISAQSVPIGFQLPHTGYVSTQFSSYHPGVDLATGLGMPIKPIAPGTVIEAGYTFFGLGLAVTIDHGYGYISTYGHMGRLYVAKGSKVTESDYIGTVGMTGNTSGPHTHLELTKDSVRINPISVLPPVRDYPTGDDFNAVGGEKYTSTTEPLLDVFNSKPEIKLQDTGVINTEEIKPKKLDFRDQLKFSL